MNDTARMLALLSRLKVEMNGAVSGAMEERGIRYGLNYGVSVPTIKDIARACAPSHSLALLLWQQDVRELKLAATLIDRPQWVNSEQMEQWSSGLTNIELVEQVVMNLFGAAEPALELAPKWIDQDTMLITYAGLLLGARATAKRTAGERTAAEYSAGERLASEHPADKTTENTKAQLHALLASVHRLIQSGRLTPTTTHGAITALRNVANHSPAFHQNVVELMNTYAIATDAHAQQVASELAWQINAT